MRIFSGIKPTGDTTLGNYSGGFRQYAATQEQGDGVLLHRRPACDHGRVRPGRPARADARPLLDARRDGARSRPLDGVRAEPRHRARGGELAAVGRDGLRSARPDDAVQGEGRPAGVRLDGALQLPRADGGRHPPLPGRHRPDRRRPAAAPRAGPRHRRALQQPLRPGVHDAGRRLPGGGGADHVTAGSAREDGQDGELRAGDDLPARRARRDHAEVQDRRDRLRPRGAPRATTSPGSRT